MNSSKNLRKLIAAFGTALMIVFIYSSGFGQSGTSSISGKVSDSQGQIVPGATVTLISSTQSFQRETTTDSNGTFSFAAIPPGTYTIETSASTFKKSSITGVQALVDKNTSVPVTLEVGEVTATVTVTADSIENIINTQDASLGNNFVSKQISQLPLEGRNVTNLLSLQPGVTPGGYVTGGRSDQANITLDGIDVNNQQEGTAFSPVIRVTPDSIEEFRVTTTNPDASKGRSAGAQISLITKSGTNEFHGNLFEYHRNTVTTANEWFNNRSGIARPQLIRHLFGGSLGGPIVKDRLFFFYNYEGMRESKSQGVTSLVPLPTLGQGIMRFYDSTNVLRSMNIANINGLVDPNGNPVVDVNMNVVNLLAGAAARYPSNIGTTGDGLNTGGFRFNAPLPVKENTHSAKFDWAVTRDQKHTISVRGNYQQDLYGRTSAFPDTPSTDQWNHPLGLAASHTWLIRSDLINRFSYGMTRIAFSNQGDSSENSITFRDIYSPFNFTRTFSRVNPTHNFTDDMTWMKGNHSIQFGTNIRLIRNKRTNWANAYDTAVTNFGFYTGGGSSVTDIINLFTQSNWGTNVGSAWIRSAQSSLVALVGRLNQYTARFNFDVSGRPVANVPTIREFATEEYDLYVQDSWKIRPNLTLTYGLRYGYSTPVYETSGLEAAPNIALNDYFARRLAAAERGQNYTVPLQIELSGKKNGKPPMYNADRNNFQPRIAIAWSPNFDGGVGGFIFGKNRQGVLRGGLAITNDYYGQQLAVSFDASNTLGFSSSYTTPANTFNLSTNPGVFWNGTNMNIQGFPFVTPPAQLVFPLQQPEDLALRIEASIDRGIQAPINYTYNATFGRELPWKMYLEASYVGRKARHLLARRDVMSPNNLRDPISGMTYYEAGRILAEHLYGGGTFSNAPNVPYFNNLFPAIGPRIGGSWAALTNSQVFVRLVGNSTDWTYPQLIFDAYGDDVLFYQTQYGALDSFGSISNSDYHGGTFSIRQRLSSLTWDLNYTLSTSKDDTSGLQTSAAYGAAFILNPIRQRDNYSYSDFDMRHIVNFNGVWQIPVGKGKKFLTNTNSVVDAFLGGWQLASIFRFNSGQPHGTSNKIFDNSGWATNWNLKSAMVQTQPIKTGVFYTGAGGLPNMFADPTAAYRSFRSPYPGETGDRNLLRFPAYWVVDLGLQKSFTMPWKEGHKLSFRWDTFNVTNTPIFVGNANTAMGFRPSLGTAPTGFGTFTGTRSNARVMQFALRYDF